MSIVDNKPVGDLRSPVSPPPAPKQGASARLTVISPRKGLASINLAEVWAYRDLLYTFALRDVKLRYRQTALGVVWVVMQPILSALIFNIIFAVVGKGRFGTDGMPSFLFIFAGQMIWSALNNTVTKTTSSLTNNANLVSKIYFPRLVLPLSNVGSVMIDFVVSFVVLLILMMCYHVNLTPAILLMPFFLLLITFSAVGFGLYMAALMASYRDVGYILPVFMQLLMYASPINYSSTGLPPDTKEYVKFFFAINPVTTLVNGIRWTMLGTPPPSLIAISVVTVLSVVLFCGGAFLFRSMESRFADVI